MICRAADGSVRDGLSLLDQAIAHGMGVVEEAQVRDMLGLADRARVFDLYDHLMRGDIAAALAELGDQYAQGADPAVVLEDMLELTHVLTRFKLVPEGVDGPPLAETERVRGAAMARALSVATLTRTWQMLLKGLAETRAAASPLRAAEMVLIRLAFVTDQPSPAEVVETLRRAPAANPIPSPLGGRRPDGRTDGPVGTGPIGEAAGHGGGGVAATALNRTVPLAQAVPTHVPSLPASFEALVDLCGQKREAILAATLTNAVHLVHFEPGRLEIRPAPSAPADLAPRLSRLLAEWTGRPWMVSISRDQGLPTLREQSIAHDVERKRDAAALPLVQAILATFPGATIEAVRDIVVAEADLADSESEFISGEEE
jgi:DNA polymerase-3 subunit gamma/tau